MSPSRCTRKVSKPPPASFIASDELRSRFVKARCIRGDRSESRRRKESPCAPRCSVPRICGNRSFRPLSNFVDRRRMQFELGRAARELHQFTRHPFHPVHRVTNHLASVRRQFVLIGCMQDVARGQDAGERVIHVVHDCADRAPEKRQDAQFRINSSMNRWLLERRRFVTERVKLLNT